MSGGSMRRFCASVPNTTTGSRPKMFMCTAEAPAMPAPDSAMVCIMSAASEEAEGAIGDRAGVMPDPEPALFFRLGPAGPAARRERLMEIVGEAALAVALQPIVVVEARADFRDRVAHRFLVGGRSKIDG